LTCIFISAAPLSDPVASPQKNELFIIVDREPNLMALLYKKLFILDNLVSNDGEMSAY
jgi:hypothetical protein